MMERLTGSQEGRIDHMLQVCTEFWCQLFMLYCYFMSLTKISFDCVCVLKCHVLLIIWFWIIPSLVFSSSQWWPCYLINFMQNFPTYSFLEWCYLLSLGMSSLHSSHKTEKVDRPGTAWLWFFCYPSNFSSTLCSTGSYFWLMFYILCFAFSVGLEDILIC